MHTKRRANDVNSSEWEDWLLTVKKFFSCYHITSIWDNKPLNDIRPYITVTINNVNISGLLDSGSATTILGNNSHIKLLGEKVPTLSNENKIFIAAGGQNLTCIGHIYLPIIFDNKLKILKCFIVPSVKLPLILGVDFWQKFELCPKYLNTLEIESRQETNSKTAFNDFDDKHLHCYHDLTDEQRIVSDEVVELFKDISYEKWGLGRTNLITHHINTGSSLPIRQRYYRLSPEKQKILINELDEMLKLKVVEPCESPWSSPVLLVPKKDGKLRFCLDSRKLNSITEKDAYNLPYIAEILDNLKNAKFLSSIDLSKAFWQIPISETDRNKTAFYVPNRGTYRFITTPFGLTNAPATQQRLVDKLFYGPEFEFSVFAFMDDIILASSDFETHILLLKKVYKKLKDANLTINFEKSNFFRNELKYLGYVVNSNGLNVDPSKVEAIVNFPVPTNKKEVKRFIGTVSWYRRFIPNFSTIADPLHKITSGDKKRSFDWSKEADESFNKLKECLISAPILRCPNYDLPFQVHTDASNCGVGGLLTQEIEGVEHPIAFMSKSLTAQERNYSITEREALAVLVALEYWRCYLDNGKRFVVYTDHSALKWFLNLNNPTGRLARWGVRLSAFNFEIQHRRGSENHIADALSRIEDQETINPCPINNTTCDEWYLSIFNGCQNSQSSFPNYMVNNNKLFRLMKSKCTLTTEFDWKEVIPAELRQDIILQNHAEPTCGHFGVFKTYKRLTLKYYWPKMYGDVVKFIESCDICTAHKHQNHATLGEMGRPKICSRPFQVISIDLVGPLPITRNQNSYIFVITCCFAKYCLLFPIRRATAAVVTRILEENVFLVHGVPSTIVLDNGRQFISASLKLLFEKYKIPKIHYTPKYAPHINLVERYNKTIITAVASYVDSDHRLWDKKLPQIQFAINNSVNEVTGFTPSFLVYGRELVTCGSHYINVDVDEDIIFQPRDAYAENMGALANIFNKVQSALLQAHSRNCHSYNLRRRPAEFNVGDIVWKRTFFLSDKNKFFSKKLAPKFIKCKIIGKKSPLVYELADMRGKSIGEWHIKDFKLKCYKE